MKLQVIINKTFKFRLYLMRLNNLIFVTLSPPVADRRVTFSVIGKIIKEPHTSTPLGMTRVINYNHLNIVDK